MSIEADSTPPEETPPEAFQKLKEMLGILSADLEEEEIALRVVEFDGGDIDLQQFTWKLLTGPERTAWRAYRQIYAQSRKL